MNYKMLIIMLFIFIPCADIYPEAFFSGNINSVNPDSGFNALRNPALMSEQEYDSAGVFYLYTYNAFSNLSGDISLGAGYSGESLKADSDEKYNGTVSASYVKKFDESAIGIGIRKPDGSDQMLFGSSSFSMSALFGAIPVSSNTTENKKSFSLSTVFSYSKELGRHESAGLQLETGISSSTAEKEKSGYNNLILSEHYNIDITTDKLTGSLSCGYYFAANHYDFGAVIKIGEYVCERQQYSYFDLMGMSKTAKDVSPYFYLDKGLGYSLGFGYKITGRLIFNIEASAGTPLEINRKELKDDTPGILTEKKSKTFINYSGSASCGFSYKYNSILRLGFGGFAGIFNSETTGSNGIKTGVTDYTIYSIIAGAEIKPAERINILFGLSSYYFRSKSRTEVSPLSLQLEAESLYINFIAGASTFY